MNLHELGPSWREQNNSQSRLSANALVGIIHRADRARWTNWLMGAIGCVIALLVVWDFGRAMMNENSSRLVQAGAALCSLGAMVLLPLITRDLWPIRSTGESTCNYFSRELRRTEKLIASNKSPTIYAVLALITVGVVLMAIGGWLGESDFYRTPLPTPRVILVIAGIIVMNIVILWLARIHVQRGEQRRVDLEALLAEFRDEEPVKR